MDRESARSMVIEILRSASNQAPEIFKPAEGRLQLWETHSGFYTVLLDIISSHCIDLNIRWIAVLYFKNGVEKYWRKNAPNEISAPEKVALKQNLINNFREPVNQIALQLAVLVSKVAKFDCPREWPELLPTLLQGVENTDSLVQHRSLLTLHHVVKAIAAKRLPGDRKLFQEFTSNVYTFILHLWNNFTQAFLKDILHNATTEVIIENLDKALLTLRILRKLTVFGFHKPHENQDCLNFLKCIYERAKSTLECRKQLRGKGIDVLELCEKFIIHLTKILSNVLDVHPFSYIDLIQPTLEFTIFYIFTSEGAQFIFERFTIQCFNLIKGILLCAEYKPPKIHELAKNPETLRANQIVVEYFQPNMLSEICKKLVSHYFLLKQEDLELWDADPETFVNDEGGESWKYSLRPSTETVFVTIFHEYRKVLSPILLEFIKENNTIVPVHDLDGILRKDAVYNAVGLTAFDLYDDVDFDQWLISNLVQELKVKDSNYRIIRRRIAWLIGNWTGIKLSPEMRPVLYECIINLLSTNEDMAVRLTASSTLKLAIDDFDFNAEQFKLYLDSAFNLLFALLKEVQECETKMHVLNVMSLVVERVGQTIRPHSDALLYYLPLLWQESEEHDMLRCAIVSTLVQLVKAFGSDSDQLNSFLLPIIKLGTDVTQGAIVYLQEDSLDLWLTVLENSVTMSNELMGLFENMPNLLEYSSENLRMCLLISYVHLLLAPEMVMRAQGHRLIAVCDNLLGDMRPEGILLLTRLVETFVRALPELGCQIVKPVLRKVFESIYQDPEITPMVLSNYLAIVSRILLVSHEVFNETLCRISTASLNQEGCFSAMLDVWLNKMCNIAQIQRRKLLALALCNLLTTQFTPVMARIGRIMTNILEVLNDISKVEDNNTLVDTLTIANGHSPSEFVEDTEPYYETDHHQRKVQLVSSDPVHVIILKDYFYSQIQHLKQQVGQGMYEQLMQTVDQDTISQINEYYFHL